MNLTTIGVIIPLPEEMRAFTEAFSGNEWKKDNEQRGSRVFYIYCRPAASQSLSQVRIVVTLQEAMGNGPAQEATTALISHYTPDLIVGLGICGAVHKDLRIGDVVVVNAVFDVIDAAKVEDAAQSEHASPDSLNFDLKLMSRPQVPTPLIVNLASQFELWATEPFTRWQKECLARLETCGLDPNAPIVRKNARGEPRKESWTWGKPHVLAGASASGFVMEALTFLRVHAFNRELRIVETECAGVARACRGEHVLTPYMFLRVVTDYADKTSRAGDGAPARSVEGTPDPVQDPALNQKRREWATGNVMALFCALAKQHDFIESVHSAIERQWDASVLLSRFRESREIKFPRERAFALAQVFTTLVNNSSEGARPEHQRLCVSAESLALTAINWEFALPDHDKVSEVWILRMSPQYLQGLAPMRVVAADADQRFASNLERLQDSFPYAAFRVAAAPHTTPFHGTFHGDTFWIGHWKVDEQNYKLTSNTDFRLINGRNAPELAQHYRALFEEQFADEKIVTRYAPKRPRSGPTRTSGNGATAGAS